MCVACHPLCFAAKLAIHNIQLWNEVSTSIAACHTSIYSGQSSDIKQDLYLSGFHYLSPIATLITMLLDYLAVNYVCTTKITMRV